MRIPVLLMVAAGLGAGMGAAPLAAEVRVVADIGLKGSEAARHDAEADVIFVSNLGERGPGNDGYISRLGPDGQVLALKWVEGGRNGVTLVDPLGVFVQGDIVYVADTSTVRRFDRKTGAPRGDTAVPGAVRLNDLSGDAKGEILVTDSGSDDRAGALYRIDPAGQESEVAGRGAALGGRRGIAHMPDGSIVHGGRGVILVLRGRDGKILREVTLPTGRMDGIIPLADGTLLVASQDGHGVYRVPPGGKAEMVAKDIPIPAAIGLDTKRNRLIIPQIVAATLTFVDLP
ncbi:hypothetical protein GCM10007973_00300 [Polymorphobacter multimanifer]|uniref:SMP-30/gluconolactonase/LRE family protein n=1 Tax=Polymorphobacter multimanifer TaxID=1070431 RepID=UPI0016639DBC|nr:hypothetical protein [Polymorphobacter multimanifer]GGI67124.1 hypothetical protein GCM10007973_00300 [Polymorphobacter multimanifer]